MVWGGCPHPSSTVIDPNVNDTIYDPIGTVLMVGSAPFHIFAALFEACRPFFKTVILNLPYLPQVIFDIILLYFATDLKDTAEYAILFICNQYIILDIII